MARNMDYILLQDSLYRGRGLPVFGSGSRPEAEFMNIQFH
jgi:hypothetical protein